MTFSVLPVLLVLLGTLVHNVDNAATGCTTQLGIKDGRISQSMIVVSSSKTDRGKDKIKLDCCKDDVGASWCPADEDKHPFVQINLPKPQAVSGLQFQHPVPSKFQFADTFLKTFNLRFVPALSVDKELVSFNQDIPAIYNASTAYIVGLIPIIVTDTIRIEPKTSQNRACFRLELLGCDPAELCEAGFCQNGGKCIGATLCECPDGFYGNKCETRTAEIIVEYFKYISITKNLITTSSYQIGFTGSVSIIKQGSVSVLELQSGSTLQVPASDKCFQNLDTCQAGFTFGVGINMQGIQQTDFYILKSGNIQNGTGIELYYRVNTRQLVYQVATSTLMWSLSITMNIEIHHWYRFDISWSESLGLNLLEGGKLIGSVLQAGHRQGSQVATHMSFQIGLGIQTVYRVSEMRIVPLIYSESIRAGISQAIIPTTPMPTTPSSTFSTTVSPCKKIPGIELFISYDLTFNDIIGDKVITPDLDIKINGKIKLMAEKKTNSVNLNGTGEFLEVYTECITCMDNLARCQNGFTIQTELTFYTQEKISIFYSGTEKGESGFQLTYKNGIFTGLLQKGYDKWALSAEYHVVLGESYMIQLSWGTDYGFQLFINGFLITKSKHLILPINYNNATRPLYIGKDETNVTSYMSVVKLMIWTATRDVLVEKNILPALLTTTLSTTVSTTTPSTTTETTVSPDLGFAWTFVSLNETTLIDHGIQIEIKGKTKSDKDGVYLQSNQQYLEISQLSNSCTGNLELCSNGISFEFEIKFFELKENTVIMSTGGESPNTPGVAVIYRFGQIQVVVTTSGKSWYATVSREYITLSVIQKFLISWSPNGSLEVYLNEKFVTSTTHYVLRSSITASYTGTLYIGHSFSSNTDLESINCEIKSFHIWHITVEIMIQIGICHCHRPTTTIAPPTTTPIPTTTTAKPTTTTAKPTTTAEPTTTTATPTTTTRQPTTSQTCPSGCVSISDLSTTQISTMKTTTRTTPAPTTTHTPTTTAMPTTVMPTTTTTTPAPTTTHTPTTTLGIPSLEGSVILKPIVNSKGEAFLSCSVKTTITTSNIQVKYSWTIIGKNKNNEKTTSSKLFESLLSAKDLDENILGKKVFCTVTARYLPNGAWSLIQKSNIFIAKIELITKQTITVIEGQQEKHVKITSNTPPQLLCPTGNQGQCRVQLVSTIVSKKEYKCSKYVPIPQMVIGWTPSATVTKPFCGSSLSVINWKTTIEIPVKATIDGLYDRDAHRYLKAEVVITGTIVQKTETYSIGKQIKVIAINRDHKAICGSVNDPHITTFDGLHYNNFQSGEYVLYRHKTMPYEVHALYKPCSKWNPRGPSCNCGVAVRSGDDVITLSGCSNSNIYHKHKKHRKHHGYRRHQTTNAISVQMYKNGNLTPGTRVRRLGCGQKYEVLLPTGTVVTVQSSYLSFINIWIKASSVDYEQSQGLCGIYNRNKKDDLTDSSGNLITSHKHIKDFCLSWRASVTIFNGVIAIPEIPQANRKIYCSCLTGYKSSCSPTMDIFRCSSNDKYDITEYLVRNAMLPHVDKPIVGRRRRALPDPVTTIGPVINSTISVEEATEICMEYLQNSTAVQSCENITQISNYTHNIENCAFDLSETGEEGFATAHVDDIINQCLIIAKSDVNHYTEDENMTNPTQDILATLCPEDCGINGVCDSGVCVCNDGFTGATCEIGKSTRPEIIPISLENEPCDINTRDCSQVNIMGINFVKSVDLSCHYQPIEVTDKLEMRGPSSTIKATFVSMYQVGCPLPVPTTSAYIRISNDGHTVSDVPYLHIVHDSRCYDCTVDADSNAHCNRRKETCSIDGVCYKGGKTNPKQSCQICNPDNSQLLWSANTVPKCLAERLIQPSASMTPIASATTEKLMASNDNTSTTVIALAATSGVLAFIVFISVVALCKQRNVANKKLKTEKGYYDLGSSRNLKAGSENNPTESHAYDNKEYQGFDSEKL